MTWKLPEDEPPPAGKQLLLLGWSGNRMLGRWNSDDPDVAWAEIPAVPDEIKERISKRWRTK